MYGANMAILLKYHYIIILFYSKTFCLIIISNWLKILQIKQLLIIINQSNIILISIKLLITIK